MPPAPPRSRIGLVTSPPEKVADYFPTAAEPDLVPTELPFAPDDQILVDELRRHGHAVVPVVWGGPVNRLAESLDMLVVRSTWDYTDSDELRERFLLWLTELDGTRVPVENHPRMMVWLTDKRYLKDLEAAGVSIVPTQVADAAGPLCLADCFAIWGSLVVKPCVSAAGAGLVFLESEAAAHAFQAKFDEACASKGHLVQRFLPEIRTAGEWSLVYLGGAYSHAVHKLPSQGKILVHAEQGGSVQFTEPPALVRTVGDAIPFLLAKAFARHHDSHGVRQPPLYLRVDIIESSSGPVVSECEGVEPELFFRAGPGSARRFRELLEERMGL
jgi:glutathione synthase/RimK-type ligase-like ATP-grasp enzyme